MKLHYTFLSILLLLPIYLTGQQMPSLSAQFKKDQQKVEAWMQYLISKDPILKDVPDLSVYIIYHEIYYVQDFPQISDFSDISFLKDLYCRRLSYKRYGFRKRHELLGFSAYIIDSKGRYRGDTSSTYSYLFLSHSYCDERNSSYVCRLRDILVSSEFDLIFEVSNLAQSFWLCIKGDDIRMIEQLRSERNYTPAEYIESHWSEFIRNNKKSYYSSVLNRDGELFYKMFE